MWDRDFSPGRIRPPGHDRITPAHAPPPAPSCDGVHHDQFPARGCGSRAFGTSASCTVTGASRRGRPLSVRRGRIAAISPGDVRGGLRPRREVDGAGRTLIPGLIDAHVHVTDWALPLLLRHGVTTVRDLHNAPAYILPLAREDAPERPRIVAAGALLDGPGSFWKDARIISTVADARAAVRDQVAAGAGVIKVYTRLPVALIGAVVQEARARGTPVAAHLGRTTAVGAARAGVSSIEHLSGIADAASDQPGRLLAAHDDFLAGWTMFEREWARARSGAARRGRARTPRGRGRPGTHARAARGVLAPR